MQLRHPIGAFLSPTLVVGLLSCAVAGGCSSGEPVYVVRGTITVPLLGRFTWSQFWWLVGAAALVGLPWWLLQLAPLAAAAWGLPIGLLGLVCAFVPVNTRPFPVWLAVYARYRRRPRRAVWRPATRPTAGASSVAFVRYAPRVLWLATTPGSPAARADDGRAP